MDVRVQGNLLGRGTLTPRPVAASPSRNNGQLHFFVAKIMQFFFRSKKRDLSKGKEVTFLVKPSFSS